MTPQAFLEQFLADGPKSWAEIEMAGTAAGQVAWALRQARKEMGLVTNGRGLRTVWSLLERAES